ncbi:FAD-dependent oxidoreductase [Pseudofrankia inefficax]|uniref:Kynurenine 3-monooxygenase n=1 Tax=Pseudofrankia inefficax (strain DSM 45817 / CECT 9037 / DDB 130130 / EuI1c) TaxID=298654 RepID=E3J2E0_PSEI1|nr:NAD(P)/FAD-dependent oxidoreductase [Pseudofrankia inefficax]ADP79312.1 Kynurenine 3-monooxygenase [Pseudofrankia inefficax]
MPERAHAGDPREPRRVVIIGAGLAGCLLATLLGRRGLDVVVYERREDPRAAPPERGRSINLAISARGLAALDQVGLREQALSRALPMHGRMVHDQAGGRSFRPYSADGRRAINSISRAELNLALLDVAAKTPGVNVSFGCRLTQLDLDTGELRFDTDEGPRLARADLVLACDGAFSAARRAVTFRPGFTFGQDYLDHRYKELTIPARDGEFALDPDALHIWPRGESMMIALPNLDRSFTCTLFWTAEQFAALRTPAQIVDHFRAHYPDVVGLAPDLVEDYQRNPLGSLATIRAWPWVHSGTSVGAGVATTLALVGDAAHAIVPFFGQGANCAFEDCVEIDRCLAESGDDWPAALAAYERRRKANCDAIAEMALDNFVEMRDRVSSKVFQAKVAAEHWLERRLPGRFVSRYELVSFTTMPYAEIPDRMRRQTRLTALAAAGIAGLGAGVLRVGALTSRGRRR